MAKQIEPCKCECGRKARVAGAYNGRWVECQCSECWVGPERKTRAGAVNAWNRVMKKARGK